MNNKILIGILIVLILAFIFTQLDNSREKKIDFFQVDSTAIATIELQAGLELVVLQNGSAGWTMTSPLASDLDHQKIADLFSRGLKVETSSLPISESRSAQAVYNVSDSSGTIVKLMDAEDNVLQAAVLGKSSQWNNTPARNLSDLRIYRLENNINRLFSTNPDYWRNKELAYFFAKDIAELNVSDKLGSYTVTATDSLWKVNNAGEISYIASDNNFLQTVFDNLKIIKADKFYQGDYSEVAAAFDKPEMEISITKNTGEKTNLVLAESAEKNYLLMKLNEDESQLYLVNRWWSEKFVNGVNLLQ